ncbi:DEAD/DEAH box helicase [Streptomyces sp. NPDC048436]|uniref:DEAD/DEAH box helicase n=1 Tax=Streptomyces sp. NPDC048436 TaxID=3365550 RepID=UPI003715EC42
MRQADQQRRLAAGNTPEPAVVAQRRSQGLRQADILRYWRAVEYFSPPSVERVNADRDVFPVRDGRPLPWEDDGPLSSRSCRPRCVWQHTVYAGVFDISRMRDVLLDAFRAPEQETDFDSRVSGHSALLSFSVNQDGQLIKDSAVLSSCAWAVSRTLGPGPQDDSWLEGFDGTAKSVLAVVFEAADGRIPVDRIRLPAQGAAPIDSPRGGLPEASHDSEGPGHPVAGLLSTLAVGAAKAGIEGISAAAATALGLGPVAGAMAAKVINEAGNALLDTVRTHAAAPADTDAAAESTTGSGGPENADMPAEQQTSESLGHEASHEPPPDLGTKVLDIHDLVAVTRWITKRLGVGEALHPDAIRVKSQQVGEGRADEAAGDAIMNSFYADDLAKVTDAATNGAVGEALVHYLTPGQAIDTTARTDVRTDLADVRTGIHPELVPPGRWPAEPDQPLAVSQQFAVNQIMRQLGASEAAGIYAVNGPPGTGKTTMLRDLVAAIVVRRAERLAELDRPDKAFEKQPKTWQTEPVAGKPYKLRLRPLVSRLTGFEILLASSNNGAVQNVTLEIPAAKAVGPSWREEADYLSGPAGLLLDPTPAWGAIAACLGKRKLRHDFVEDFWWHKPPRARQAAAPTPSFATQSLEPGQDRKPVADSSGLRELLTQQAEALTAASRPGHDAPAPPLGDNDWAAAVTQFRTAQAKVRSLARERARVAEMAERLATHDPVLDDLHDGAAAARRLLHGLEDLHARQTEGQLTARARLDEHRGDVAAAETARHNSDVLVRRASDAVAVAECVVRDHDRHHQRPGRLRRWFQRDAVERWRDRRHPLVQQQEAADLGLFQAEAERRRLDDALYTAQLHHHRLNTALRTAQQELAATTSRLASARRALSASEQDIAVHQRHIAQQRRQVEEARTRWGAAFPGQCWQAAPDDRAAMEERELSAPWMDPEFASARTRLFLAALDLHRAVLACEPRLVRENLRAAMDVVKGAAPPGLPAATVLAAWQMLFLIVPVVSTTFASLGRMFGELGQEALGWLFIDEAGQASPQQAVGALWRSKRAVVVGDPLQLEPVVTLPWTGQKRLCRHFGVDEQWAPAAGSVQSLADRVTPYGTWLSAPDSSPVWLGSPLRVHRRCDRLMFEVSNEIAYDGMMVYGVGGREAEYELLHRSLWLHVPAKPSGGKWNPEEGRFLERTLDLIEQRIQEVGTAPDAEGTGRSPRDRLEESVFVVSPFRDVASALHRVTSNRLSAGRVGTVHTTQGKEADVVVLVLGTACDANGSRAWAASSPNLLNVAVTRARRRLVVIGDRTVWSRHRYFSTLADHSLQQHTNAREWRE